MFPRLQVNESVVVARVDERGEDMVLIPPVDELCGQEYTLKDRTK